MPYQPKDRPRDGAGSMEPASGAKVPVYRRFWVRELASWLGEATEFIIGWVLD